MEVIQAMKTFLLPVLEALERQEEFKADWLPDGDDAPTWVYNVDS